VSEENYKFNIPEEIYGQVIEGIDLQILSSDSVRIIEAYVKQEGELSDIQIRVLNQCENELEKVLQKSEGNIAKYFAQLQHGVKDVLEKLKRHDVDRKNEI